jgi:hypothetical protein
LGDALADATAATWELARTTSEPAARLGREVLDATGVTQGATTASAPDESAGPDLLPLSSMLRVVPNSPAPAFIQELEDRLATSVRPLSSSARQAFGFLRTPALGKQKGTNSSPASKGA